VASSAGKEYRERELKFDTGSDWELPDAGALGCEVERRAVRLESTYYDTAASDLLRHRVTLRRRAGDDDAGWQLKVPHGDARTEIRLPASAANGVPAELRAATIALRRGATLRPVARLVTEREAYRLVDDERTPLAEIVLDTVTATELGDVSRVRSWREVEVELLDGDERFLHRVARWLRKRGAARSASGSKLARALDFEPAKPRDPAMLSGLAGGYLDTQADVLVRGDIALRRGQDAIHETRVATRRYRSVLRELGDLFDAARAAALDAELRWYADALGAVRDRHVLREHLDRQLADLPPELVLGPVAARIHQMLAAEERDASEALAAVMRTKRYYALLAEVRAWREALPLADDRPSSDVARYLDKAVRRVGTRIAAAPEGAGRDEALHRARKAAKRGRYLAELARPELGADAKKLRDRMKKTQQRLGLRQDAVVAAEFLRRAGAAAAADGENGFTFGLLYEREQVRAAPTRDFAG
jgi:CHAD domain-containing protein